MENNPVFTKEELEIIDWHNTPAKVQSWLDTVGYSWEEDGINRARSFRRVVRDGKASCMEGALAAAAILSQHDYSPKIVCMEATDMDHNIFVYNEGGRLGSVAKSRNPKRRRKRSAQFSGRMNSARRKR